MKSIAVRVVIFLAVLFIAAFGAQALPPDQPDQPSSAADRTGPRIGVQEPGPATQPEPSEKKMTPREMKLMRGDIYMARKMYVEAAAVYQDMLREEPRNAELLNKVGVAYHLQSRLGDAKKYYKRALKVDKNFPTAYNNLGMVEYHRKKYKNAIKEFNKAIKLDPTSATYQHNIFHAYWSRKKYDEALLAFQHAIALDPLVFERRGSGAGPTLQSLPSEERAAYYFFVAKSYAVVGDAERCALYLQRAREEGYKEMGRVNSDPAFAVMRENPLVQKALGIEPVARNPKP